MEASEAIETLDPPAPRVSVRVRDDKLGFDQTYNVGVVSYFVKLELVGMLGGIVNEALTSEGGFSVAALLSSLNPDADASEADDMQAMLSQFSDPDVFIQGIVKLVSLAPDRMDDLYCVFMGIPKPERVIAKMIFTRPESDGGLSDDQGIAVLDAFIDLNGDVLRDFFVRKMAALFQKARTTAGRDEQSSTPSKSTRRNTPKR